MKKHIKPLAAYIASYVAGMTILTVLENINLK